MRKYLLLLIACLAFTACSDWVMDPTTVEFRSTDDFSLIADIDSVLARTGSTEGKLVFKDAETRDLVLLDFSTGDFSFLTSGMNAYHPEISPDGKFVAFSSDFESSGKRSKLFVLNFESKRLIQLDVESAAIPRWLVLENGDTVITYVDNTGLNQYSKWKDYATWKVPFRKGSFGTPKKIMKGAYTSISGDFRYAATGSARLITRKKKVDSDSWGKDTTWFNGDQVCNVSMAKDDSKRISFLDLMGAEGVAFVGSKYYGHGMLFVADSLGKIIQAVPSPKGFVFDHTEWTQGEFEIATLEDYDGNHKKIVLVDMKTEEILDLVLGENLYHPCLWLKK